MSVDTKRLSGNTDALAWAEEFVKEFDGEAIGDSRLDTGTMIGWFANAIETGRAAGEGWDAIRARRQLEFLEIMCDGAKLQVNGIPWREAFERLNAIVADPVPPLGGEHEHGH